MLQLLFLTYKKASISKGVRFYESEQRNDFIPQTINNYYQHTTLIH